MDSAAAKFIHRQSRQLLSKLGNKIRINARHGNVTGVAHHMSAAKQVREARKIMRAR